MRFSEKYSEFYIGKLKNCYVGYSVDSEIRSHCASGGVVSTILCELLRFGDIQGALVVSMIVQDGKLTPRPMIATSPEEVLAAGGSIYCDVNLLALKEQILQFPGTLAMVGLPCHFQALERLTVKHPELAERISLRIGLFCGHNSKKELLENVLRQKAIKEEDIAQFSFRKGHWRGSTRIVLHDGTVCTFPFTDFSLYQNLHLFSLKKCLYCGDHTAETSDISCGDVWLRKMKQEQIKHSIFFSRTDRGDDVLQRLIDQNTLITRPSSGEEVFLAQKRSIIHHKNLYVRSRLSKLFGLTIPCPPKGVVRWNDYISTLMILINVLASDNTRIKHVWFKIPRPLLFGYLLFFKLLTNF